MGLQGGTGITLVTLGTNFIGKGLGKRKSAAGRGSRGRGLVTGKEPRKPELEAGRGLKGKELLVGRGLKDEESLVQRGLGCMESVDWRGLKQEETLLSFSLCFTGLQLLLLPTLGLHLTIASFSDIVHDSDSPGLHAILSTSPTSSHISSPKSSGLSDRIRTETFLLSTSPSWTR